MTIFFNPSTYTVQDIFTDHGCKTKIEAGQLHVLDVVSYPGQGVTVSTWVNVQEWTKTKALQYLGY